MAGRKRRSTAVLVAAGGFGLLLGHGAGAGDLVPGGWLQPYRVPDVARAPVVAPAPSGTSAKPPHKAEAAHKAESRHRVEARGHRPAPVRPTPPPDGNVRF